MTVGSSWEELGIRYTRPGGKSKCPACKDKRKQGNERDTPLSFVDDHYAKCHNCKTEWLVDRQGYTAVPEKKDYKLPPQMTEYNGCGGEVVQFFEGRGISGETLSEFKVTSQADSIEFNYFEYEKLVNVKYRGRGKKFRLHGGAQLIFYNINALYQAKDYIIITEGEIDAMSYAEADLHSVISVPNGASAGSMNLDYLTSHFHLFEDTGRKIAGLKPLKKIVLAFDDDDAGYALQQAFIRRLGADKVYIANMQGSNDPNELLMKRDKVAVHNSYAMAKPAPIHDVKTVHDLSHELEELRKNGLQPGAQVGTEKFRERISFEVPRMTIVTGVSTHGKSEFLDDIIARLAVFEDWKFGVFSPENFPIEYHISKLVSKITGKAFNDVEGLELEECYNFIAKHFFWIYPEDDNYTLENILRISDLLVGRYGINGLIIDPWTEVDKLGKNGTEDINEWLSIMSRYKRNKSVHMFLVAHPKKMAKGDDGKVLMPDLMDISGSGHFYNKTDAGISVYRDFEEDTVLININKIKFKHLGKIGQITMLYHMESGRYQEKQDAEMNGWDTSNWLHREEQLEANMSFEQPTITPSGTIMEREPADDLPF